MQESLIRCKSIESTLPRILFWIYTVIVLLSHCRLAFCGALLVGKGLSVVTGAFGVLVNESVRRVVGVFSGVCVTGDVSDD